jgi:dTDP-4-dehydrorhamnose reductase
LSDILNHQAVAVLIVESTTVNCRISTDYVFDGTAAIALTETAKQILMFMGDQISW